MHHTVANSAVIGPCDECTRVNQLLISHTCASASCCGVGLCAGCVARLHLEDIVEEIQDRGVIAA